MLQEAQGDSWLASESLVIAYLNLLFFLVRSDVFNKVNPTLLQNEGDALTPSSQGALESARPKLQHQLFHPLDRALKTPAFVQDDFETILTIERVRENLDRLNEAW